MKTAATTGNADLSKPTWRRRRRCAGRTGQEALSWFSDFLRDEAPAEDK